MLLAGWEHSRAATAESAIAAVLTLGIIATLMWPASPRGIALSVEAFALLGTLEHSRSPSESDRAQSPPSFSTCC